MIAHTGQNVLLVGHKNSITQQQERKILYMYLATCNVVGALQKMILVKKKAKLIKLCLLVSEHSPISYCTLHTNLPLCLKS